MRTLVQDLRYSVRQLGKSPGFAMAAIVSLALGIGATSAVFSVLYAALMNPYPYPAADRIVRLAVNRRRARVTGSIRMVRRFSSYGSCRL